MEDEEMTDCDWLCVHCEPASDGYSERTSSLRDWVVPEEEPAERECSLHHWMEECEEALRAISLRHWVEAPDSDVEMADLEALEEAYGIVRSFSWP
jgi:hypothetical protein